MKIYVWIFTCLNETDASVLDPLHLHSPKFTQEWLILQCTLGQKCDAINHCCIVLLPDDRNIHGSAIIFKQVTD